eukprot:1099951-Pyramimonas_sp.AAC.1
MTPMVMRSWCGHICNCFMMLKRLASSSSASCGRRRRSRGLRRSAPKPVRARCRRRAWRASSPES